MEIVEKTMSTQKIPHNGEVWWVNLPNQPNDPHQPRTAIIVSTNGRNRMAADVIVVPTTSYREKHHQEYHIFLPAEEGGLPNDSLAKCEQITTLDKSLLGSGPLGAPIKFGYRERIINAIKIAIGDTLV